MAEAAGRRTNQKRSEQDQKDLLDKIKKNGQISNSQFKKLKSNTLLDAMRKIQADNEQLAEQVKRISANSSPANSPSKTNNNKEINNIQKTIQQDKSKIARIIELFESCTEEELIEFNQYCDSEDRKEAEANNQSSDDDNDIDMDTGKLNLEIDEEESNDKVGEEKIQYKFVVKLDGLSKSYVDSRTKIEAVKGSDLKVENAFYNRHNKIFYVMTNDEETNDLLSKEWPIDCGIKVYQPRSRNEYEIEKESIKEKLKNQKLDEKKYFIAIRGVDISKKIEKNTFEENGVVEATRILQKSTGTPLFLIKARAKDEATFERLITHGLKDGWTNYRVKAWTVDQSKPLQCYKCLKFGHHQSRCKETEQVCLKCGENHSYKDCEIGQDKLKCSNCKGNHAAVSKCCEEAKKASIKKTTNRFDRAFSKFDPSKPFSSVVKDTDEKISVNEMVLYYFGQIIKLIDTPHKDKLAKIGEQLQTLISQK
jgi:hypothetical protein